MRESGNVGESSFSYCESLKKISLPCVRSIEQHAFYDCEQMTDVELGEGLDTIAVCILLLPLSETNCHPVESEFFVE